jgi:hypothetical protein
VDGKVSNTGNSFARMDFSNMSFGNLNASPAFTGLIDMNFVNTSYVHTAMAKIRLVNSSGTGLENNRAVILLWIY